MALVKEDAIHTLKVHDGEIDVRVGVTVGRLMVIAGSENLAALGNPTGEVLLRMLDAFIVAWRGEGYEENGEPVPVTPESIKLLDMDATTDVVDFIQTKMGVNEKKGRNSATRSPAANGQGR